MVKAGGWVMVPLLICSILALAIVFERAWALRRNKILPPHLVAQTWHQVKNNQLDAAQIRNLRIGSPLGRVIAAGLVNLNQPREIMLEAIEDTGRHEAHNLERFLNTLGTVATVSPLLGLLGTVTGMIEIFNVVGLEGPGRAAGLAAGIGEALITTATGLIIAIPALVAYRYFRGKVDALVVDMEKEALKLVEVIHGQREREQPENNA